MSPYAELPCWVIMNCAEDKKCPAKENPHRNCWELFSEELDDSAFNICQDCIVFLASQEQSVVSRQEMEQIMLSKGISVGAACGRTSSKFDN